MRSLYLLILLLLCTLQSFSQTTRYVKVTSQSQIVDGGEYIIVAKNEDSYYMGSQYSSLYITCVSVSAKEKLNDDVIVTSAVMPIRLIANGDYYNLSVYNGKGYRTIYAHPNNHDLKVTEDYGYSADFTVDFNTSNNTVSIYADKGGYNQQFLRYYSQTIRYYESTSGRDIYLYKKQPSTQQVSVSDVSYASFCSEYALDFTNSSITAYKGRLDGDALKLERVMQVPKNTGLILFKDGGVTDEGIPVLTEEPSPIENNALIAATEAVAQEPGYTYYVLGKKEDVGFYRLKSDLRVPAGKAYMKIENTAGTQSAREGFAFNYDDVITSIRPVEYRSRQDTLIYNSVYNLQGQRVVASKRGIYIINGRKVMK